MARGPRISDQLRERIVAWRQEGTSIQEISRLAGCKERAVYKVLALHRNTGSIATPETLKSRGRPRVLSTPDVEYITSLLADNPAIYLDEIQEKLATDRGVDVSLASISRTLHRLPPSHKTIAKEAAERDELLRATWIAMHGDIPMDHFVWLDESSVDDITNQRRKGWSPIGQACVRRATFIRGQRYSVLPALSVDGLIALDISEGSVNKAKFISFVENDLAPLLNRYPGPRSVVVMDNCAIHHNEDIRRIVVDECGAKLIYLPPYSPDLNPIEQAFHCIKSWLRLGNGRDLSPDTSNGIRIRIPNISYPRIHGY